MNYNKLYLKDNGIWEYQEILSLLNIEISDLNNITKVAARLKISNIIYISNEKHV